MTLRRFSVQMGGRKNSKVSQKVSQVNFLSIGICQMAGTMRKKFQICPIGPKIKIMSVTHTSMPKKWRHFGNKQFYYWLFEIVSMSS